MNLLSREKRARILELSEAGRTVSEIAKEVGVSRESVVSYGIGTYRRRLFEMTSAVMSELEKAGMDPLELPGTPWADAFMDLHYELGWKCPVHPEADPDNNEVWPGIDCRLCVADGLKRHHERRKAAGRPIVPPRRKPKVTTPVAPEQHSMTVTEVEIADPETVDWDSISEITHRRLHMNQDWIEFSRSQEQVTK